jgi:hypothetical protein
MRFMVDHFLRQFCSKSRIEGRKLSNFAQNLGIVSDNLHSKSEKATKTQLFLNLW